MSAPRRRTRGLALSVRIAVVRAAFGFGRMLPLRRRVLIATTHEPRLRGNLALIHEELVRHASRTPVVVLAHGPRGGLVGRLVARVAEARIAYHVARASVVVIDDYCFPLYPITPRAGTRVIQAWHACGAFKQFGYSVLDKAFGADEQLIGRVRIHANYDVCLVSSASAAPHYAEAFDQPLDRFRADLGIPHTDLLVGEDRLRAAAAAVRTRYGIPAGRRVVLFAPTFRGESIGRARHDDALDLRRLHERLGDDHVVLVRQHPFVRAAAPIPPDLGPFAIDVSDHPDINELLPAADILVTDYSSVIYEFAILGRPMVFFAPDLEAYERERGFYFDYRTGVPGSVVETTDEVADAILDPAPDLERVAAFRRASFDVLDGRATERVVRELIVPSR